MLPLIIALAGFGLAPPAAEPGAVPDLASHHGGSERAPLHGSDAYYAAGSDGCAIGRGGQGACDFRDTGALRLRNQQPPVEFVGRADAALDRRIRDLLAGEYLLIHRDTLILRTDTIRVPVLVLAATARIEGVLLEDLVAIGARIFLRPRSRIVGDAVSLQSGFYRSGLAAIEGEVIDRPLATYRVLREPDRLVIEAWIDRARVVLDGFRGFQAPRYDRVDAITLGWGAAVILGPFGGPEPRLHGHVAYRSGRGTLTGGAELRWERGRTAARLGAERVTRTADDWIAGDVHNTLAFFFGGRDYRDYYDARRAYGEVARGFGRERLGAAVGLRAEVERAASLAEGQPWTVIRRDRRRPNAAVDDGTIAGVTAMATGEWHPGESRLRAGLTLEVAGRVAGGEYAFGRHAVWGDWVMPALADHVLEVAWRFQGPLPGTDSLPRQRWTHVGGMGTLPFYPVGAFRGDRVVAVHTDYVLPVPERLGLPLIGAPDLRLQHRIAMAWTADVETPELEQNLGLEARFLSPFVRAIIDPAAGFDDVRYEFGFAWPLDRRPWRGRHDSPLLEPPL